MKNIPKHLFHLITSTTEIIEFENVKFPKRISSKDSVWRGFLEIDSNSTFSKKGVPKKREFSNQIYFSPTFWKSWVHISDNIAGVVGGPKGNLFLCPIINWKDIFKLKDLLSLEKAWLKIYFNWNSYLPCLFQVPHLRWTHQQAKKIPIIFMFFLLLLTQQPCF